MDTGEIISLCSPKLKERNLKTYLYFSFLLTCFIQKTETVSNIMRNYCLAITLCCIACNLTLSKS
jgi:hypothetical protein